MGDKQKIIGIVCGVIIIAAFGFSLGKLMTKPPDTKSLTAEIDRLTKAASDTTARHSNELSDCQKNCQAQLQREQEAHKKVCQAYEDRILDLKRDYEGRILEMKKEKEQLEKDILQKRGMIRVRDALLYGLGIFVIIVGVAGTMIGAAYRRANRKEQESAQNSTEAKA